MTLAEMQFMAVQVGAGVLSAGRGMGVPYPVTVMVAIRATIAALWLMVLKAWGVI